MLSGYRSLLFVLILSVNSFGQIFTEGFNYLLGQSFPNNKWSLLGNKPWIVEGDLYYDNYPSGNENRKLLICDNGGTITASLNRTIDNGTVYCSFLLQLYNLNNISVTGEIFFGFVERGYVMIKTGQGQNTYRVGIQKKDASTPDFINVDLNLNQIYLIVISYTFNVGSSNDVCKLWVNPDLQGPEPIHNASNNSLSDATSITQINIKQTASTGDMYIDAIRVATTWDDSALPVELEAFNAEVINNSVVLNWSTATEVNNYGFEVERSFDKSNWECVKFVPGNGNSNRVIHYTYTDNQAAGSTVYYRLKQVDTDGSFTYSEVAEVKLGEMKYTLHQNYPNPFNPETTIKYSITQRGFVNIKIYDMTGKEVKQLVNESMDSGEYSVKFNGSALPSGVYMYRIRVNGFVESRKMLLLK